MSPFEPWANPLAGNPLRTRTDVQQAVRDLYSPLIPHRSPGGARVRLGSFGAVFEPRVAELEAFARPLHGIVPLAAGGGEFAHWEHFVAGLEAGTDPGSPEYWGPVGQDVDQRMVEQAAIGLALAFCPERVWEPLGAQGQGHLVRWLQGIFEHEPAGNNWQFFRVLVALGLERVGAPYDRDATRASLELLETFRLGEHWYADGDMRNVDYYVPWAFHTYGLVYAAAADSGLGDRNRAEQYRQRAAGFAADFQHWFAADGAGIPMGRSLTYRFAMASFWGALAWADVEPPMGWGAAKGLFLRHLRWWSDKAISDRDGVLSVGYTYDNRRLRETYNSAGSPYWAMKAFTGLAAAAEHPFWDGQEAPLPPLGEPVTLSDAGWVLRRDGHHAVALIARPAIGVEFPEQASAKYRRFAYSSAFGFSGEVPDVLGRITSDSMLTLADETGERRIRNGVAAAGVEDAMAWTTWFPWDDARVDSVCWFDGPWHGRCHRVRTPRPLESIETGFAVGFEPAGWGGMAGRQDAYPDRAVLTGDDGTSVIADLGGVRRPVLRALAVDANLLRPHAAVPGLQLKLDAGDHRLVCAVFGGAPGAAPPAAPSIPDRVEALLERVSEVDSRS